MLYKLYSNAFYNPSCGDFFLAHIAAITVMAQLPEEFTDASRERGRVTDNNTGNSMPFSYRIVCGFFSIDIIAVGQGLCF